MVRGPSALGRQVKTCANLGRWGKTCNLGQIVRIYCALGREVEFCAEDNKAQKLTHHKLKANSIMMHDYHVLKTITECIQNKNIRSETYDLTPQ